MLDQDGTPTHEPKFLKTLVEEDDDDEQEDVNWDDTPKTNPEEVKINFMEATFGKDGSKQNDPQILESL